MTTAVRSAEQLVILDNVSWETYERLLTEQGETNGTRFTYDAGVLEIMVLSARHEKPNRTLALLVEVLAEEQDLNLERFGSTTFKRADLLKGFEPDSCFYIQNADIVSGKQEIDLTIDPPPDLIIEVDITSPSLNRFPIFAAIGVPEVWRYDGERVSIFRLTADHYLETEHSLALSLLTGELVTAFLEESHILKSTAWLRHVRTWVRSQKAQR